jgi:osmotically-inducible protein OsmY
MSRILAVLLLPLLAVTLGLPGYAASDSSRTNLTQTNPAQTHPAVSDAQLDAAIRAKLAKSKIGKDGFHFHVQRGVVTWEGTTGISQHKGSATRMARSSGAVQVVNNIKVTGTNAGKDTPPRKAEVEP